MAVGVNIVSSFDAKGIRKAVDDFKKLEGAGNKATFGLRTFDSAVTNGVKNLAKFGAVVGVVAGVIGRELINAASDLEESQSKVNVVFGESSQAVTDFASTAAKSMGISKQAALEATGTYGNLLQAFGVAQPQAVEMSTTLVQLAGDLASFNNTSVEDAIQALRSGLSGETEPLKRFGVAINDVRLKQEAMNLGLYNGKGNLDINAKTQAAYALILKDTSLAQGDYARTSDGVANTQKTLKAQFDDLKATLGTALIPVYKTLLGVVQNSIMPVMTEFAEIVGEQGIGAGLKFLGGKLLDVIENGGKFTNIILGLVAAFTALRLIAIAATISQTLFNAALFKNPIGIVVAAVIALGVAVVAAYLKFEGFRKVVHSVINFAISIVEEFVNYFINVRNKFVTAINIMIKAANLFGAGLTELSYTSEVEFGRISTSANKTSKEVSKLLGQIQSVKNAERQGTAPVFTPPTITPPAGGGGGSGDSAIEKAKKALEKYIDAVKGVTTAQRSMRDATKGVTESNFKLSEAISATAKAQANFNKVTKGYGLESKEVVKQTREVADAQRNLMKANISAADSVQAVKDAEEALQKLREKVDPFDIESAEIKLQKAKFNVEEADFAVLEAEKDLADLRKDKETKPEAIRKAEIKLAESKFGVRDAVKSVKDAEKELNKLRTDTPTLKEIAVAERAVADAKRAAEDASIAQADAQTSVNEAQYKLNQLVEGATIGSDAYTEALKLLTDAEQAEKEAAEARVSAYEKLADATRDLAKAEQERRDSAKGVSKSDRAAADAAEAAAATVVVPALTDVVKEVADVVTSLPSIVDAIVSLPSIVSPITQEQIDQIGAIGRGDFSGIDIGDQIIRVPSLEELLGGGMGTLMADGGIVTRATSIIAGEAGAEAIIPLDRMGSFGSTYNISVTAGMGADGKDIGTQIVNALKRYERTNGALPLTVA
jgi:hypothetical protein